jgi:asparagine synthase (glutamine-hydrolysing)
LLAESGLGPLQTFTSLHEGIGEADDRPYAQAVVRQGSLDAHAIDGEAVSPMSHVDELVRVLDGPYDNPHLSSGWDLRRLIQKREVRVVLGGDGGDDTVFYGPMYLAELARSGHWIELLREARGLANRHFGGRCSTWVLLRRSAIAPLLPSGVRRFLLRYRGGPAGPEGLINPKLAQRCNLNERRAAWDEEKWAARSSRADHCRHLEGAQIPYALESGNVMSAPFGFEDRPPFFDRRVVELCLALPRTQRVYHGLTRVVVRRALADLLPEEVRTRGTKGGPNLNFVRNFLQFERATIEGLVGNEAEVIEDFVDIDTLRNTCDRFLRERTETDGYQLWTSISLARWLRSADLSH